MFGNLVEITCVRALRNHGGVAEIVGQSRLSEYSAGLSWQAYGRSLRLVRRWGVVLLCLPCFVAPRRGAGFGYAVSILYLPSTTLAWLIPRSSRFMVSLVMLEGGFRAILGGSVEISGGMRSGCRGDGLGLGVRRVGIGCTEVDIAVGSDVQ